MQALPTSDPRSEGPRTAWPSPAARDPSTRAVSTSGVPDGSASTDSVGTRTVPAGSVSARAAWWRSRAPRLAAIAALALAAGCAGPGARRPAPIADRPIDLAGRCAQTEDDGFREDATVSIRNNDVQALSWKLWVGRRGSCSFDLADFRQTKRRPHIELAARDGSACRLLVWQEPRRVTLAHANCERRCTAGIYEQAWPVMFDPKSGACSSRN